MSALQRSRQTVDLTADTDQLTVLVVDDDQDWRVLLDMHLSGAAGINLIGTVSDANAAVGVLEQLGSMGGVGPAVNVVVADLRMPGMSGLELAALLQKYRPDVRVVLFSSYLDPEALIQARIVGVDALVSKFDLRRLPDVIRTVSHQRGDVVDLTVHEPPAA